jgi:hypothetical protein
MHVVKPPQGPEAGIKVLDAPDGKASGGFFEGDERLPKDKYNEVLEEAKRMRSDNRIIALVWRVQLEEAERIIKEESMFHSISVRQKKILEKNVAAWRTLKERNAKIDDDFRGDLEKTYKECSDYWQDARDGGFPHPSKRGVKQTFGRCINNMFRLLEQSHGEGRYIHGEHFTEAKKLLEKGLIITGDNQEFMERHRQLSEKVEKLEERYKEG